LVGFLAVCGFGIVVYKVLIFLNRVLQTFLLLVQNIFYTYNHLPDNFITKKEARALGWTGGSLESYAPGKCIGGDYFGNYEELLPVAAGRTYTECDINTLGARSRGAERLVWSNDGLIYYTDDHYESFTLLYGEE